MALARGRSTGVTLATIMVMGVMFAYVAGDIAYYTTYAFITVINAFSLAYYYMETPVGNTTFTVRTPRGPLEVVIYRPRDPVTRLVIDAITPLLSALLSLIALAEFWVVSFAFMVIVNAAEAF